MVKTIFAILLAAMPAYAAEFNLERSGLDAINKEAALPAVAAPEYAGSRLQISEIENRWIAAIYVTGQKLARLAGNANGIAPHSAPPGYAIELGNIARRTMEGAEKMHYAALDKRWHVVAFEADKLDRMVDNIADWAMEAQAHHNAVALRAVELSAAGRDLASALQWLRADSGGLMRKELQPAIMPLFKFTLACSGEKGAVKVDGFLSRKGGDLRVTSPDLYKQHGGEGENLRFFPEAVYVPGRAGFLSSDSAFFNYTLEMPSAALAQPGEFKSTLLVTFDDETTRSFPLDCASKIVREAPAAPEKPCKMPGPGATIEEIIAWIRCVPLPPLPGADKAACRGNSGYMEGLDTQLCPNPQYVGDNTALCGVKGAAEIFKTDFKREDQLERMPFGTYSIVDLGLWPDDSTSMAYSYNFPLFTTAGKKIGYAQLEGYVNPEMESRTRLLQKYTPDGKLASVTVLPW